MELEKTKKNRIKFNSLKELEITEIQEEEKYISNLKIQREKIEEFHKELSSKDIRIKELEEDLKE